MQSDPKPAIFTAEALRRHVDGLLAEVPVGHGYASIEYRHSDGTVRVVGAARVGEHWRVDGTFAWALRAGKVDEASVRVVGSWGD